MQRRYFLIGATSLSTALFVGSHTAAAQENAAALMAPGPLPERIFGLETAPVKIIEYASMTCGHCQNFHVNVWPELKKNLVDTGKAQFILREFPFDPRATAAFMLARCVGEDKWYPAIDLLFRTQEKWARAENGKEALLSTMAVTGMTEKQFEACLGDQVLLEKVNKVAEIGKSLGVDSTPTFFINGQIYKGVMPAAEFQKIVEAEIVKAKP